ncbi:MAG: right-handed parallel beta-helix repeat-containing protein, partial [Candidatus Thorarchaeota archaeon]|nr:right-handed parallel beta-helix repeat-containing protein [Candidatus Thorarchaeota archaeon]
MNRSRSIAFLLMLLLTISLTGILSSTLQRLEENPPLETSVFAELASSEWIVVIGDDDFVNAGFIGAGTPGNPYTLTNVDVSTPVECVFISHTTAYFVIEDSSFTNMNTDWNVVELLNVTNGNFRNCVFDQGYNGIRANGCTNITLVDCQITGVYNHGLDLMDCSGVALINTSILESYRSIYQMDTNNTFLDRCYFSGASVGMHVYGENTTITNCTISENGGSHISSNYGIFRDNYCFDTTTYLSSPSLTANFSVSGNTFISCGYGVSINLETNFFITNNTMYDCSIGVFFQNDPRSNTIANNTLYRNQYSIVLSTFGSSASGGPNDIYHNIIGWNTLNAKNTAGLVSNWDDGVRGNSWSRYSGPGTYVIDGGQADVDNYPSQLLDVTDPTIESPGNIAIFEGSTGNYARWNVSDDFLFTYLLDIDGTIESHTITDDYVILDLDNMTLGSHTIDILVIDAAGNSMNDSIIVDVIDDTPPTIDSPSDFTIIEGLTGDPVSWEVFDEHPNTYTIFIDDEVSDSKEWSGSMLTCTLNGLG